MPKTVADSFADALLAAGIKGDHGTVGDGLNGLTGTTRRQQKIEWVHARHEEVAAAAGAEAHLTGCQPTVEKGIAAALAHDGAVLIDAVVARSELAMPPVQAVMSGRGDELIDLARTNL